MAEFKLTTLYVDYQHLMNARDILAKAVTEQYYRSVLVLLRLRQKTRSLTLSSCIKLPPLPSPRAPKPCQEVRT
jgi:hypothetical protein